MKSKRMYRLLSWVLALAMVFSMTVSPVVYADDGSSKEITTTSTAGAEDETTAQDDSGTEDAASTEPSGDAGAGDAASTETSTEANTGTGENSTGAAETEGETDDGSQSGTGAEGSGTTETPSDSGANAGIATVSESDADESVETAEAEGEETTTVATIGETSYETLAAAIAAVTDSTQTTIRLTADVTEDVEISSNQNIILDLNGCTLKNSSSHTITNKGTLTVTDGSDIASGTVDNVTHGKAAIVNYGTAYLYGGTFTRSEEAGSSSSNNGGNSYYTVKNYNQMTIGDGTNTVTIKNNGSYSSCIANGYQNASDMNAAQVITGTEVTPALAIDASASVSGGINCVKNDDYAILIINGGTFTNTNGTAIQNHSTATINGGTFTASTYAVYNCGCDSTSDVGSLTITGGTFSGKYAVEDVSTAEGAEITISGGTFTGTLASIGTSSNSTATISVSGGTYSSDVSTYLAEGYEVTASEDSTYTVASAEVAKNETTGVVYSTLQEAVDSATSGDTVTLLKDVTLTEKLTIYKSITLALGDYTITSTAEDMAVYTTQTLTITADKGGITASATAITNQKGNGTGTLTIEGGTYTSSADNAIYNNNGTVNVKGGIIQSISSTDAKDGIRCYGEATVTVNGGTISGARYGIYSVNAVTITDGAVSGEKVGVYLYAGTANISGGTISGYEGLRGTSSVTSIKISDGTFEGTTHAVYVCSDSVTVSGGTFTATGTKAQYAVAFYIDGAAVTFSGGTFTGMYSTVWIKSESNGEYTIADGYMVNTGTLTDVNSSDNAQVRSIVQAVADVDGTYYATLADAFVAAVDGSTVTLLADVTLNESLSITLSESASVTLDLNGYTITFAYDENGQFNSSALTDGAWGLKLASGTLTIKDSSENSTGTIKTADVNTYVNVVGAGGSATLIIESGNFTTNSIYEAVVFANGSATVEISGGTFTNSATSYAYNSSFTEGIILNIGNSSSATISVTGGTFIGRSPAEGDDYSGTTVTTFVADGYKAVEISDGVYTVVETGEYVAANTNTYAVYGTLQEAIDEASSGDTIQLLTDVTENITIGNGQTITLDLAGHTLNGDETYAISVKGGTFTLKDSGENGTVEVENCSSVIYVYSSSSNGSATFILESGTVTGGSSYGIYAGGASSTYRTYVTVSGGYITENGRGVWVGKYTTLTMSGGTISGNKTTGSGGGVYMSNDSGYRNMFVMTGGVIAGNQASVGGGVYAETHNNSYYFQFSGGAIYGNTATGVGNDIYATNVNSYTNATILNALSMTTSYNYWRNASDGTLYSDTTNLNGTVYLTAVTGSETYDTYTVSYEANNGTGTAPTDSTAYTSGMIVTVLDGDSLSMDGYYFSGWNTASDGTGIEYEVGETFFITEDVTLYAVWKETVAVVLDTDSNIVGYYNTLASAVSKASSGQTVQLMKDITLSGYVNITKVLTIDLNGHNITFSTSHTGTNQCIFYLSTSGSKNTLTLTNSQSTGGSITNNSSFASNMLDMVVYIARGHLIVGEGVTLTSTNGYAIYLGGYTTAYNNGTIQATVKIDGGTVSGGVVGIAVVGDTKNTTSYGPVLTVNKGTITGGTYGISGNGTSTYGQTFIYINGGTITGTNGTGIYHPQVGTLTVTGGEISGPTGIEIRAGELDVSGGTITGTATTFTSDANGSGTTVDGAGIAVSQHSTNKELTVKVTGGTISGYYGIYEVNYYAGTNTSEVTINISEADADNAPTVVKATGTNAKAVYSESISGSTSAAGDITTIAISGGHFTTDLANTPSYIANGYEAYTEADETTYAINGYPYTVGEEKTYAKFYTRTLTLDGSIGVNYYVDMTGVDEDDMENYTVVFTVDDKVTTAEFDEDSYRDDFNGTTKYYRFTVYVTSVQMATSFTAKLQYNGNTIQENTYSVKTYCEKAISNSWPEKGICEALLNYGGYAEVYFTNVTSGIANANLSTLDTDWNDPVEEWDDDYVSNYEGEVSDSLPSEIAEADNGTHFYATLLLQSQTVIRIYFNLTNDSSTNTLTFKVDNTELSIQTAKEGDTGYKYGYSYYVEFKVPASKLDEVYTINVSDTNGNAGTVSYSALAYVNSIVTSTDSYVSDAQKNVCKALYYYSKAANEYSNWR